MMLEDPKLPITAPIIGVYLKSFVRYTFPVHENHFRKIEPLLRIFNIQPIHYIWVKHQNEDVIPAVGEDIIFVSDHLDPFQPVQEQNNFLTF